MLVLVTLTTNLGTVPSSLSGQTRRTTLTTSIAHSTAFTNTMAKRKVTLEVGNPEGLELLRESLRHVQEEAHIPQDEAHTFVVLVRSKRIQEKFATP